MSAVAATAPRERMLAGLPSASGGSTWLGFDRRARGGDGPPLVLLHGGIECGGAIWAPVVSRLAERHRS